MKSSSTAPCGCSFFSFLLSRLLTQHSTKIITITTRQINPKEPRTTPNTIAVVLFDPVVIEFFGEEEIGIGCNTTCEFDQYYLTTRWFIHVHISN